MSEEPPPPEDKSEPKKPKEPKRIKVRISLFFDGTGNNRYNTDHRVLVEKPVESLTAEERAKLPTSQRVMKEKAKDTSSSYYNDYSNVARLEKYADSDAAPGYEVYIKVYTDGIGTADSEKDSPYGNIAGKGDTGVERKVEIGLSRAVSGLSRKLMQLKAEHVTIEKLSVDTFGFSRGATAARNCVHKVLHSQEQPFPWPPKPALKERLKRLGMDVEKVEVRAVGVYDTVSAMGIAYIDISDVPTLHLDCIREANAVLHLAAAEEYRRCFSLTNIDSAKSAGVGVEIFLPGAHSDVGGGYRETASEEQIICSGQPCESISEYLVENGWYSDRELLHRRHNMGRNQLETVSVRRTGISNEYSFIPLRIMAEFTREQELTVKSKLETEFDPINLPGAVRGKLESYAQSKRGSGESKASDWQTNEPELRSLRHDFLHFSSRDELGFHLRTMNAGTRFVERPTRKVFSG
ncbi:MAG TPA: DUF2235 domain-containing protein [Polyangiales bacterium]|nr:DUF2235 domain-containing protein [Polyangiales bacterium]